MSRARAQEGFTLVELLLVCTLSVTLLTATLYAAATMQRRSATRITIGAIQDETRNTLDRMVRQVRNSASQADGAPQAIERAQPQDLVFRAVNPIGPGTSANPTNIRRVRYCTSGTKLYEQVQPLASLASIPPLGTACPLTGDNWSTQQVSPNVVNATRPLFTYLLNNAPDPNTEVSSATTAAQLQAIVGVRATVYVDDNVTKAPGESTLTTEVYLRNQNRPPIAAFSASPGKGTAISLDGGDSYDPEGGKLTFDWYDGATKVGSGAFFVYDGGAGTHTIKLTVTDPAGNVDTADPKTFTCTTSGGCIAS